MTLATLIDPLASLTFTLEPSMDITVPPLPFATGALILIDLVGVLRGWQRFNHLAHLSGAAFGTMYYFCGLPLWNATREGVAAIYIYLEDVPSSEQN